MLISIRLFAARVMVVAGLLLLAAPAWADQVVLVAGGGDQEQDGVPAIQAKLHNPFGVEFDSAGAMYIVELEGGHIHKVDPAGKCFTVGGTGKKGDAGDGGNSRQATFNAMHGLAIDPQDQIYIADTLNHRVRIFNPKTNVVAPFAGTGAKGYKGDAGPARTAEYNGVYAVALSPDKKILYIADLENRRIRAVELATGTARLIAGNGERGVPADGAVAREAPLVDPRAVASDRHGNVYVLERGGHALRVVDRDGKIRTVAGTGKAGPLSADGPALAATFRGPKHLCLDADDNVIIADTDNHVIRKLIVKTGQLVRVAGTGKQGVVGVGGSPEQIELNQPHGVTIGPKRELFIVDSWNDRVLKIVK